MSTTGQTLSFPPASSLPGPFQLHPPDVALSPRGFVCLVALDRVDARDCVLSLGGRREGQAAAPKLCAFVHEITIIIIQ